MLFICVQLVYGTQSFSMSRAGIAEVSFGMTFPK